MGPDRNDPVIESTAVRFLIIVAVALAAHLATVAIRGGSRRLLASRLHSEAKARTVTGFATSIVVFAIYFGAVGYALSELGVSLTTYLASATVIGLAVSFGSQGVVQDVITGLTVVFSDLLDVGDMVDIGGQVGIVESVGMRFTALVNFQGARVYVPNRAIGNVVNYPKGYVHAWLDVRLPADPETHVDTTRRLEMVARTAYEQYPGILLLPPVATGPLETGTGVRVLRLEFRLWPGQGALVEGPVRAAVLYTLKQIDPAYADWMATVHYRAEPAGADARRRLPRPAALSARPRGEALPVETPAR